MLAEQLELKQAVIRVLDELSKERIAEVLDFALFLKTQRPMPSPDLELRTLPVSTLVSLTGLVDWGGDAVEDTEKLYDL